MFPFADDTRSYSVPIWIFILIATNVVIFFASMSGGEEHYLQTIVSYGTIPARFFQPADKPLHLSARLGTTDLGSVIDQSHMPPPILTLLTAMFLHGGLMHLIGNMWFLWIFGDNIEDRMGKLLFPIFYVICGLCAGLLHVVIYRGSSMPTIGASGAIAGIMGAYLYMFPRSTIATLMGFGFYFTIIHVPSQIFLGIWFLFQLIPGLAGGVAGNVAFMAHVGGFIAGLLLAMLFSSLGLISWAEGDRGHRGFSFRP